MTENQDVQQSDEPLRRSRGRSWAMLVAGLAIAATAGGCGSSEPPSVPGQAKPAATPAAPTPPSTPAPSASAVVRSSRPVFPPAADPVHGGQAWSVVLAIAPTFNDPKLAQAQRQAEAVGYPSGDVYTGQLNCDLGAREGLVRAGVRLNPAIDYGAVSLNFRTQEQATAFVDAYEPGVVGTVLVKTMCLD